MVEIGRGLNILPYRMKSAIEKVMGLGELVTQWRTTFQSPEVVDDLPGCIPSFEEVDGVVRWAELCQEDECEEAAWNHDVHLALLRKVFGDAEQKINAMLWYVLPTPPLLNTSTILRCLLVLLILALPPVHPSISSLLRLPAS